DSVFHSAIQLVFPKESAPHCPPVRHIPIPLLSAAFCLESDSRPRRPANSPKSRGRHPGVQICRLRRGRKELSNSPPAPFPNANSAFLPRRPYRNPVSRRKFGTPIDRQML